VQRRRNSWATGHSARGSSYVQATTGNAPISSSGCQHHLTDHPNCHSPNTDLLFESVVPASSIKMLRDICEPCKELGTAVLGMINLHDNHCLFGSSSSDKKAADENVITLRKTRQYCSCFPNGWEWRTYKSESSVHDGRAVDSIRCAICAFIHTSIIKIRQQGQHIGQLTSQLKQILETTVQFEIKLQTPGRSCEFRIDGVGSLKFGFFQVFRDNPDSTLSSGRDVKSMTSAVSRETIFSKHAMHLW
jgi:hypothetical protein